MAKNFLVDINLNQNELQNGVIQNLASDPNNAVAGQVYFNTQSNKFRVYNGTSWDEMGTGTGEGTVTSVAIANAADGGLTVSGSPVTSSGTINIGHSNVLSSDVTTSGVYPVKIDKNGHITEVGTAIDFGSYATLASPAFTGTPTAPTATAGTNTTQIATTAFVANAVSNITGAMTFKGTVGIGGTVTTLPTTGVKVGDTYKVCSIGTFSSQEAEVGDLFIATATTPTWAYVPSGDDVSVTSITAGAGLNTMGGNASSDGGTITTTGTINLTKSGVTEGTYQGLTVDKYGRVTSATALTLLSKYTGTITGNATTTTFSITHNLGSRDVVVNVYDGTSYEDVIVDIERTSANAITVKFASAPSSSKTYKVVIIS